MYLFMTKQFMKAQRVYMACFSEKSFQFLVVGLILLIVQILQDAFEACNFSRL